LDNSWKKKPHKQSWKCKKTHTNTCVNLYFPSRQPVPKNGPISEQFDNMSSHIFWDGNPAKNILKLSGTREYFFCQVFLMINLQASEYCFGKFSYFLLSPFFVFCFLTFCHLFSDLQQQIWLFCRTDLAFGHKK